MNNSETSAVQDRKRSDNLSYPIRRKQNHVAVTRNGGKKVENARNEAPQDDEDDKTLDTVKVPRTLGLLGGISIIVGMIIGKLPVEVCLEAKHAICAGII